MLETIELPGSGRTTTRIGFGCSGLMGGLNERESLGLLETAFDAGIRHFDVAPSYGHGQAERCLGKFLHGKSDKITVTTKYGILPAQHAGLLDAVQKVARPIARQIPSFRHRAARAAAGLKTRAHFSAEEAQRSLEHSLRELNLDAVDLWLLHEATTEDLSDPNLLLWMQQKQREGKIGAYGLGTARRNVDTIWQSHREYCPIVQFEWSVIDEKPVFPGAFYIYHRSISGAIGAIQQLFRKDPGLCRRWSDIVDVDLAQSENLSPLLLCASSLSNPKGIVLFSSRVPAHIRANMRVVEELSSTGHAVRLVELLAKEYPPA